MVAGLREGWREADLAATRNFNARAEGGQPGEPFHAHPALFAEGLSPPSRAARCYLLAESGQIDLPLAPRAAEPIHISADQPAIMAAGSALRECLDQIATNFVVVMKLDDSEGPHQLRNGFRRLRAVLSAFAPLLDGQEVTRIRGELDWLDDEVGRLRDLDVLIAGIVSAGRQRDLGLDWLAEGLGRKAEQHRERLRELMSRRRARAILFDLARLVDAPREPAADGPAKSVLDMSRSAIATCWKQVSSDRCDVDEFGADSRHELRRKVRHLRCTAGLFRSLFPTSRTDSFLSLLRTVQSTLGTLNDVALLTKVLPGYRRNGFAGFLEERGIDILLQNARHTEATTLVEARSAWRELLRAKAFWG